MRKKDKASQLLKQLTKKHAERTEKALTKKSPTGALYRRFCFLFKEQQGFNYISVSKVGDMKMIKEMESAYGIDLMLEVMAYFFRHYNEKYSSEKYLSPKIGGLRVYSNDIASALMKQKQVEKISEEEEDFEWG